MSIEIEIRSRKTREERSRETEKGSVQNPSENSPRISGEVKITPELSKQNVFYKDNQETIVASLKPSV